MPTTESVPFDIGDIVHDGDDSDPDEAVVVNIPQEPAKAWVAYEETTVAADNPEYPDDAPVVVVAFADAVSQCLNSWDHEEPLGLETIREADVCPYSFPAPRLTSADNAEQPDTAGAEPSVPDSVRQLKERLEVSGMQCEIESDGRTIRASKLGDSYRLTPGELIEGDGPLQSRLLQIVAEYE